MANLRFAAPKERRVAVVTGGARGLGRLVTGSWQCPVWPVVDLADPHFGDRGRSRLVAVAGSWPWPM